MNRDGRTKWRAQGGSLAGSRTKAKFGEGDLRCTVEMERDGNLGNGEMVLPGGTHRKRHQQACDNTSYTCAMGCALIERPRTMCTTVWRR